MRDHQGIGACPHMSVLRCLFEDSGTLGDDVSPQLSQIALGHFV
jgi:hypothetical protein